MRDATTILTIAMVGVLGAAATATAADGTCTSRASVLSYSRSIREATFSRRNSDIDKLRGYVTYAEPNGSVYVAYVYVIWGDVDDQCARGDRHYCADWDGSVSVSQGRAEIMGTLDFDTCAPKNAWRDHPVYRRKVAELQHKRAKYVRELQEDRREDREDAFDDIDDRRKLQRELHEIDHKYAKKLAKFDEKTAKELAKLRGKLQEKACHGPDRLLCVTGRKVSWEASATGGTDGVLVRVVTAQPCVEGVIRAGRHRIKFRTQLSPKYRRYSQRQVRYQSPRPRAVRANTRLTVVRSRPRTRTTTYYRYRTRRDGKDDKRRHREHKRQQTSRTRGRSRRVSAGSTITWRRGGISIRVGLR